MRATNVINLSQPPIHLNPGKWFTSYDKDLDEILDKNEVINGLIDTLSPQNDCEKNVIREVVKSIWDGFDDDCSGSIDKWDFLTKGGMASELIRVEQEWNKSIGNRTTRHILNLQSSKLRRHTYLPPPIFSDGPDLWFKHFDIDKSGFLSQREAIHGIYVTLNAVTSKQRADIRKHVLSWDWKTYDDDVGIDIFVESGIAKNIGDFIDVSQVAGADNSLTKENAKEVFKVKVFVPDGNMPGDLIKVHAPKSQENVLVMIPEKAIWAGGNGESPSFDVNFLF